MVTTTASLKIITTQWKKLLGEKITPAKFTDLNRTGLLAPGKPGGVNKDMLVKWM